MRRRSKLTLITALVIGACWFPLASTAASEFPDKQRAEEARRRLNYLSIGIEDFAKAWGYYPDSLAEALPYLHSDAVSTATVQIDPTTNSQFSYDSDGRSYLLRTADPSPQLSGLRRSGQLTGIDAPLVAERRTARRARYKRAVFPADFAVGENGNFELIPLPSLVSHYIDDQASRAFLLEMQALSPKQLKQVVTKIVRQPASGPVGVDWASADTALRLSLDLPPMQRLEIWETALRNASLSWGVRLFHNVYPYLIRA